MCRCIIGWVEDETVVGDHSSQPKLCAEYLSQLEKLIVGLGGRDRLLKIREAHGVRSPLEDTVEPMVFGRGADKVD